MRLAEHFCESEVNDESLVRNKSDFTPKSGKNKTLEKFIDTVTKFPIHDLNVNQKKGNMSKKQWKSLIQLKNDENIIKKEADKGNAVVVMNSWYYKELILKILDDQCYYEKCQTYNTKCVLSKLNKLIDNHGNGLTTKEIDYITNFECKESNFYGLPKVHKSKQITDACTVNSSICVNVLEPSDLKLRPIVAGPSCETHRLSNLIDIILKPLVTKVKSYIKDTTDFLNYLPNVTNPGSLLVTFDVTNLYSNIEHSLGIEAITYWIEHFTEYIPARIHKNFIIEGTKFILENNYLYFDNNHYRQVKGTAMDTKVAPTYATLVLGYLETKLYDLIEEQFGNEERTYIENNFTHTK